MNQELNEQATYPNVSPQGDELLRRVLAVARETALDVITYAIARRGAKELAAALEPSLQEEATAAAGPAAAVLAAERALPREEGSVAARVATYFKRKAASALAPGEGEPPRDWPRLQQLRIDLAEARSTAEPFLAAVRHREGQIAALRACPRPDRAVMEALGLAYNTVPASRRRGAA